ncbi:UNVERIFIED_CONTAM: hypothetical protein HDU68_008080 [Siphonaria sp. JEL0065]|nr:hypothetical protein HDU68_008080 [Siphonaria sp. JEL0065]
MSPSVIHITHLPPNYTKEEVLVMCQDLTGSIQFYGKYCYATFENHASATNARRDLRIQTNLVVTFAKPKPVTSATDLVNSNLDGQQDDRVSATIAKATIKPQSTPFEKPSHRSPISKSALLRTDKEFQPAQKHAPGPQQQHQNQRQQQPMSQPFHTYRPQHMQSLTPQNYENLGQFHSGQQIQTPNTASSQATRVNFYVGNSENENRWGPPPPPLPQPTQFLNYEHAVTMTPVSNPLYCLSVLYSDFDPSRNETPQLYPQHDTQYYETPTTIATTVPDQDGFPHFYYDSNYSENSHHNGERVPLFIPHYNTPTPAPRLPNLQFLAKPPLASISPTSVLSDDEQLIVDVISSVIGDFVSPSPKPSPAFLLSHVIPKDPNFPSLVNSSPTTIPPKPAINTLPARHTDSTATSTPTSTTITTSTPNSKQDHEGNSHLSNDVERAEIPSKASYSFNNKPPQKSPSNPFFLTLKEHSDLQLVSDSMFDECPPSSSFVVPSRIVLTELGLLVGCTSRVPLSVMEAVLNISSNNGGHVKREKKDVVGGAGVKDGNHEQEDEITEEESIRRHCVGLVKSRPFYLF